MKHDEAIEVLARERECQIEDIAQQICDNGGRIRTSAGWRDCSCDPCPRYRELLRQQALKPLKPGEIIPVASEEEVRKFKQRVLILPTDPAERNKYPMFDGLIGYFPNALAAVSNLSFVANEQHNPGEPIHWALGKSTDHANKIVKHLVDHGQPDTDGTRHSTKLAWRALALLEEELVAAGAPRGRNVY